MEAGLLGSSIGDNGYYNQYAGESEKKPFRLAIDDTLIDAETAEHCGKKQPRNDATWNPWVCHADPIYFLSALVHFVKINGFLRANLATYNCDAGINDA
ncbi:MAG: hypothetical protein LBJ76_05980 [Candidatus Accumulibacter sp.]|nr:hypothetical protein [Accumulibacter sp.]